jgi:hypothetical protein
MQMKKLIFVFLMIVPVLSGFSQAKVFFYGEKQCVYVISDSIIHESGTTNCTARAPLYIIKGNKVYEHNNQKECALVLDGDKVYFPSRNTNEIDRLIWIVKDNELVFPDRQTEAAFIIEDNKVYYGSNNKVSRKDRQVLTLEGDVPKVALYLILHLISQ